MMTTLAHLESTAHSETGSDNVPQQGLLELIAEAPSAAALTLASGRRYELATEADGDRLIVRARNGHVLLRVTVTDAGPVLAFEAAELELRATRTLGLAAETIDISASNLQTHVAGSVETHIAGSRHTRIDAADHLEAGSVQVQANDGAMELRAAGRIALDGEHIGLNDDPCPRPFEWSAIADGPESAVADEKEGV